MTHSERVDSDTVRSGWHTRGCVPRFGAVLRGLLAGMAGALLGCLPPMAARAELRTLDAQVVWARPGWCYLASTDSTLFTTGIAIVIARGDRVIAAGRITRVHEPRLAAVRLDSGGLEEQDHLETLRVRGESARDVRMTHLYTTASLLPNFRGAPAGQGTAIPRGGRRYTGNVGVAGSWPPESPAPSHDRLHEDEAHHVMEPAFAD